MKNAAGIRFAIFECPDKSSCCELRGAVSAQCPSDDLAGTDIHHHRKKTGLSLDPQKGDIANPLLVDRGRYGVPDAEVLVPFKELLYSRCPAGDFPHSALQIRLTHKPGNAVFTAGHPLMLQVFKNPRTAIGLMARLMDRDDLIEQSSVGFHPVAHRPFFPCVVAAPRYPIVPAEESEPVVLMMPVNKGEDFRLCSKLNWVAFFKRSFSIWAFFKAVSSSRIRLSSVTFSSILASFPISG